jgi:hypothetical protein
MKPIPAQILEETETTIEQWAQVADNLAKQCKGEWAAQVRARYLSVAAAIRAQGQGRGRAYETET